MRNLLLMLVFLFSTQTLWGSEFRALLVGVDYQDADANIPVLPGAVNDTEALYRLMTGSLGVPAKQIRTLKGAEATRAAIRDAVRAWLIEGTSKGDRVFFAFSGHGIQVPDPDGGQRQDPVKRLDREERVGVDSFMRRRSSLQLAEALAPHDTRIDISAKTLENLILDSELNRWLSELEGREVTLWLDHCHAGGATRSFGTDRFRPRSFETPWAVEETRLLGVGAGRSRGLQRRAPEPESWRPPYRQFAAAKYFQKALEDRGRGLFTEALTELLGSDPSARYTNKQVIEAARDYIEHRKGVPPERQLPMYYGPPGAEEDIFPLLRVGERPAPQRPPLSLPEGQAGIRVAVSGDGAFADRVRGAIDEDADWVLAQTDADLILSIGGSGARLYHPSGPLLEDLPLETDAILHALRAQAAAQTLTGLHNPATPFQVEMWLDEKGKRVFRRGELVTLYYKVEALPYPKAYLTLLNLAPDGSLGVLYPQPDRGERPADGYRRLYLSAPVEPGRIHSIPQGQGALRPGEYAAKDLMPELNQLGTERFKAIVTPRPLELEEAEKVIFSSGLTDQHSLRFAKGLGRDIQVAIDGFDAKGWGVGDLIVEVK